MVQHLGGRLRVLQTAIVGDDVSEHGVGVVAGEFGGPQHTLQRAERLVGGDPRPARAGSGPPWR